MVRFLGEADFGKYNFALSLKTLIAIFADLLVNQLIVREIARNKKTFNRLHKKLGSNPYPTVQGGSVEVYYILEEGEMHVEVGVIFHWVFNTIERGLWGFCSFF